jgi:hypothetical protein
MWCLELVVVVARSAAAGPAAQVVVEADCARETPDVVSVVVGMVLRDVRHGRIVEVVDYRQAISLWERIDEAVVDWIAEAVVGLIVKAVVELIVEAVVGLIVGEALMIWSSCFSNSVCFWVCRCCSIASFSISCCI